MDTLNKTTNMTLSISLEQAQAMTDALDLFARVGLGQLEVVAEQVSFGLVPKFAARSGCEPRSLASPEQCEYIDDLARGMKDMLGIPRNGSLGIGHSHVHGKVHRAWEMKKVIEQALAIHRNPNPEFRGVNYDGLFRRYTDDPLPVIAIGDDVDPETMRLQMGELTTEEVRVARAAYRLGLAQGGKQSAGNTSPWGWMVLSDDGLHIRYWTRDAEAAARFQADNPDAPAPILLSFASP